VAFRDRTDAGQQLALDLVDRHLLAPIVLALPRGGVPVAFEVATQLDAPLEVFVVRKVGAPLQPEYGIGAVAEGGSVVVDRQAVLALGLSAEALDRLVDAESKEVQRRVRLYRGERALPELTGRDVIVVDDGLATGVTAEAALAALRAHHPRSLVLAAPVCAVDTALRLRGKADEVVCTDEPKPFGAVGWFYERFDQTSDDEVLALLARAAARPRPDQVRPATS
jgi:predicted phosphoribosyltransferase